MWYRIRIVALAVATLALGALGTAFFVSAVWSVFKPVDFSAGSLVLGIFTFGLAAAVWSELKDSLDSPDRQNETLLGMLYRHRERLLAAVDMRDRKSGDDSYQDNLRSFFAWAESARIDPLCSPALSELHESTPYQTFRRTVLRPNVRRPRIGSGHHVYPGYTTSWAVVDRYRDAIKSGAADLRHGTNPEEAIRDVVRFYRYGLSRRNQTSWRWSARLVVAVSSVLLIWVAFLWDPIRASESVLIVFGIGFFGFLAWAVVGAAVFFVAGLVKAGLQHVKERRKVPKRQQGPIGSVEFDDGEATIADNEWFAADPRTRDYAYAPASIRNAIVELNIAFAVDPRFVDRDDQESIVLVRDSVAIGGFFVASVGPLSRTWPSR